PKSPSIGIIGALRHFEVNAALWMPPEEGVESGAHLPEGFPRSQIIVNLQHQITLSFDQPHGGVASGVGAGEGADGAQHRAAADYHHTPIRDSGGQRYDALIPNPDFVDVVAPREDEGRFGAVTLAHV